MEIRSINGPRDNEVLSDSCIISRILRLCFVRYVVFVFQHHACKLTPNTRYVCGPNVGIFKNKFGYLGGIIV